MPPKKEAAPVFNAEQFRSEIVQIKSSDQVTFHAPQSVVAVSRVMQAMLQGEFAESASRTVTLPFRSDIVELALQYLFYKVRWDHEPEARPQFQIPDDKALELISLSDFLKI